MFISYQGSWHHDHSYVCQTDRDLWSPATYSSYLINLWFPSICHSERGAWTKYVLRLTAVSCNARIKISSGHNLLMLSRIRSHWTLWPLAQRCPRMFLYPHLGKVFRTSELLNKLISEALTTYFNGGFREGVLGIAPPPLSHEKLKIQELSYCANHIKFF